MLALKDVIGNLDKTPISASPMWHQPINQILPAQLAAFRQRLAADGRAAEADAILKITLNGIAGQTGDLAMRSYSVPKHLPVTSGQLKRGLALMHRTRRAAVLFGLESGMAPEQVITLKWTEAHRLIRFRLIRDRAFDILQSQAVHIRCQYVFWQQVQREATPLFGLDQDVFDAFGLVWAELVTAYDRMVMVDEDAERVRWQDLIFMVISGTSPESDDTK